MAVDDLSREVKFQTELRGNPLTFSTTWGLFSPRTVDAGTHLLIEYLDPQEGEDLS